MAFFEEQHRWLRELQLYLESGMTNFHRTLAEMWSTNVPKTGTAESKLYNNSLEQNSSKTDDGEGATRMIESKNILKQESLRTDKIGVEILKTSRGDNGQRR